MPRESSLFRNPVCYETIRVILKFTILCVPPAREGFVFQYFEHEHILSINTDLQIAPFEHLAHVRDDETSESSRGLDLLKPPLHVPDPRCNRQERGLRI
jgi:hypothetical protein